jgi:FecR protein
MPALIGGGRWCIAIGRTEMVLGMRLALVLAFWWVAAALVAGDQDSPGLFLAKIKGGVTVVHDGKSRSGQTPQALFQGDRVVTGPEARAYLEFANGGTVEVGPGSATAVKELDITPKDFKARFLLAWGEFRAKVRKLAGASSRFEVQAGGVVAGVRGTVFGVDYDKAEGRVEAQTFEGTIFTRSGGKERLVEKGYALALEKTGIPIRSPLTGSQMDTFRDFLDVSGQLERKKDEMLRRLHEEILQKVPGGVLPQKQEDDLKNAIGGHLPF